SSAICGLLSLPSAMRRPGAAERCAFSTGLSGEGPRGFACSNYPSPVARAVPRPVQRPHPPIHVGGAGERRTLPVVARHADVWNCPTYALGALESKLAVLREECRRIGRAPETLGVTEEAVLALVPRRDQVAAARGAPGRRAP